MSSPKQQRWQPLALRKNVSWTFIGNVIFTLCQFGMLVLLAKFGSKDIVGRFSLSIAICTPVFFFTNQRMRVVLATDVKREYQFSEYLFLRMISIVVAICAILIIILLSGYDRPTNEVILAVAVARAFESVSFITYGFVQQQERMDRSSMSMIYRGILSLGTFGAGFMATGNVMVATLGMAAAWAAVLVVYDLPNCRSLLKNIALEAGLATQRLFQIHLDRRILKLAWISLPMGLTVTCNSLVTHVPRYFIEAFHGEGDLGIFAAMAYPIVGGNMMAAAIGQSSSPKLAKLFAAHQLKSFRSVLGKTLAVVAALGVIGILLAVVLGRELLTIIYTAEYSENVTVFILLMLGAAIGFFYFLFGAALTGMRRFWTQAAIQPITLAITLLCSYFLIQHYNLMGAAYTVIISSGFATIVLGITVFIILRRARSAVRLDTQGQTDGQA